MYNIALEPGTGTRLREIDVRRQRSSVPGKLLKDGPKTAVHVLLVFKQERALPSTTKVTSTGALASGLATTIAVGLFTVYWETSLVCCHIVTHACGTHAIRQQTRDISQYQVNNIYISATAYLPNQ